MWRTFGSTALAVTALAAVTPAHSAVTFDKELAVANASAYTDYGDPDTSGTGFGTKTRTLTSFAPSVLAAASAQADSYDDAGDLSATATGLEETAAKFSSAAAGTIDLAGITSATVNDAMSTAEAYSEGQGSTYSFSVDTRSRFDLTYLYTESAPISYANSVYIGDMTSGSTVYSASPAGINTSGALSFLLDPGSYVFNVYTEVGDDAYASGGTDAFGNHEEYYTFNISAAPEPASWALMLAGVGLAGSALRQARRSRNRRATRSPDGRRADVCRAAARKFLIQGAALDPGVLAAHSRLGPDGRAVALLRKQGRGKSGLHGDMAAGNTRRERSQGQRHRKQTARVREFSVG